jgi:hypothetical protein
VKWLLAVPHYVVPAFLWFAYPSVTMQYYSYAALGAGRSVTKWLSCSINCNWSLCPGDR